MGDFDTWFEDQINGTFADNLQGTEKAKSTLVEIADALQDLIDQREQPQESAGPFRVLHVQYDCCMVCVHLTEGDNLIDVLQAYDESFIEDGGQILYVWGEGDSKEPCSVTDVTGKRGVIIQFSE